MVSLGGGKGGGQTQTTSSYTQPYTPYLNFATNTMNDVQYLENKAMNEGMPQYGGELVAPNNATQQQAFGQVSDLQGSYKPYFNNANSTLNQYAGYNPIATASPYFTSANNTPTALQAGQPYANAAAGTFNNPSTVSSYMSPYINNAVNQTQKLATNNFLQNTMPGLNSQFVASGGGLGGFNPAYTNASNWALTNFNNSLNNTTAGMLNTGYGQAAQNFQSDQARLAGLSGTVGGQASATQQGYTNLGTAAGNNVIGGMGTGINLANSYAGLGTGQLNAGLLGTNALLQAGNQQQQQQQSVDTANYNQWMQQQQWPYQVLGWGSGVVNQFQWPQSTNSSTQGSSSGSPLGSIFGGLATLGSLAIPGAGGVSALGNLFSGLGGSGVNEVSGYGAGISPGGGGLLGPIKRGGPIDGAFTRKYGGENNKSFYGGDEPSEPVFTHWPNDAYKSGGFYGGDEPSEPVRSYPFGTFENRSFFSGGIDGPSEPVFTHWSNDAYAEGGEVPGYGIGGTIGSLIGSLFGGQGSQIGGGIGDIAGMVLPFLLAHGGSVPGYADGGDTDGQMLMPIPQPPAQAGSDAAIAREMEDRQADEDAMKAAQWFNGAFANPDSFYYDNGDPFRRRPNREIQMDSGGFFGGDAPSQPVFTHWPNNAYNTGGYVPTVTVARGHYSGVAKSADEKEKRAELAAQRNAVPLQFAEGGSVIKRDVGKHEQVMHSDMPRTPIDGAGFFSNERAVAAVHKHEQHDHRGKGKTKIKLKKSGSAAKRMAKAVWAHDHHMHPGMSRTPLGHFGR